MKFIVLFAILAAVATAENVESKNARILHIIGGILEGLFNPNPGPAIVEPEYEPISVGPAIIEPEYEEISVGPAIIEEPVPDPAVPSPVPTPVFPFPITSPLVQLTLNINKKA